jgi:hypothetical protein
VAKGRGVEREKEGEGGEGKEGTQATWTRNLSAPTTGRSHHSGHEP